MVGKRCKNANDFLNLIKGKNTSIYIHELLNSDIEHAVESLGLLFDNVKAVPDIQKIHSMTVIDVNKIKCKIFSNSTQKTVVDF
jgi:hypothetical protein